MRRYLLVVLSVLIIACASDKISRPGCREPVVEIQSIYWSGETTLVTGWTADSNDVWVEYGTDPNKPEFRQNADVQQNRAVAEIKHLKDNVVYYFCLATKNECGTARTNPRRAARRR